MLALVVVELRVHGCCLWETTGPTVGARSFKSIEQAALVQCELETWLDSTSLAREADGLGVQEAVVARPPVQA